MKVVIDTRHDTLERALAVVALAFGSDGRDATSKPNRTVDRAASGGKQGGRRAPVKKTSAKNAPPKKATARKTVATGPAASGTVAEPSSATRTGASRATANRAKAERTKAANVAPPGQSDTIRAWARSRGMQVADAGRMPASVIAAYNAQHD